MGKHCWPGGLEVLVEPDAGAGFRHDRRERRLAHFEWIAAEIVAVQFNQVERIEELAGVVSAVTDALEARHSALVAGDGLPIDDAGTRAQSSQGFDDQQEAV